MMVETLHPGVSREQVQENTGFELLWADNVTETPPPTSEELQLIREQIDPGKLIIGRAVQ